MVLDRRVIHFFGMVSEASLTLKIEKPELGKHTKKNTSSSGATK